MGRLFINNQELDLPNNFRFARTKQVNTIGRLDNRQANYTQNIRLPRTKNNTRIFNYLGALGNSSVAPYQLNGLRYVNESGIDEIFDGRATVRNTNEFYNIAIYDGFVSFTKAIENRVLTDIDLSELNHLKNLTTIENSWNQNLNYRYIIADYNGNTTVNGRWNIDFLIPSVNVRYLWDRVHQFAGFTYDASIVTDNLLDDLWITYPKAISDDTQVTIPLFNRTWTTEIRYRTIGQDPSTIANVSSALQVTVNNTGTPIPINNAYLLGRALTVQNPNTADPNPRILDNFYVEIVQTALFKVSVRGTINRDNSPLTGGNLSVVIYNPPVDNPVPSETREIGSFSFGQEFNHVFYTSVTAGRFISIDAIYASLDPNQINSTGSVIVEIEAVTGNTIDFEEAFIDFSIQDFINEILWRFSLTPFKEKYRNHIQYLTSAEWLQNTERLDWSASQNKYISPNNESYVLSGYAQRNYMRYQYDDDILNHNDGFLDVANSNIASNRDIISSNMFSPEPERSSVLGVIYNIYKFWDREPQDSGEIKYKDLENRFYMIRSQRINQIIGLESELSGQTAAGSAYDRESFSGLSFTEIINNYYRPLHSILNSARLLTANIYLNDLDIANIDFRKLIYIREEGSYFIINRVPNYIDAGIYRVQLLEVDLGAVDPEENVGGVTPSIALSSEAVAPTTGKVNWSIVSNVQFISYTPQDGVIVRALQINPTTGQQTGVFMEGDVDESTGLQTFELPNSLTPQTCGLWQLFAIDANRMFTSTASEVIVPCPTFVNEPRATIFVRNEPVPGSTLNPITREVVYRFENYTPTSGSITIQRLAFPNGNPVGSISTNTITQFAPDTDHVVNLVFQDGLDWYRVTLITPEVTVQWAAIVT